MIGAWLREDARVRGDSMMIGDIVVALQPEGGLPALGQTTFRRKHLTVWRSGRIPVTAHADERKFSAAGVSLK